MAKRTTHTVCFRVKNQTDVRFAEQLAREISSERHEDITLSDVMRELFEKYVQRMKEEKPATAQEYYNNDQYDQKDQE